MYIQKLTWAGIALSDQHQTVLIDPIDMTEGPRGGLFSANMGKPREKMIPLRGFRNVSSVLVTHLHSDHFDPAAIISAFGADIPVYVPMEAVGAAQKSGLRHVIGMRPGEQVHRSSMCITATHAVDGFGAPQVSWVVHCEGQTVIHCGDTLWHGHWWQIARQYGPIRLAFLPVNGAVLHIAGLSEQSTLPACMTPEEAVEAARLMGAGQLIPIHFRTFHHPPHYIETPDLLPRLHRRAAERNVPVRVMATGEAMDI
jgi:L-ascorbate metabolism protein UlaG (beta-lactamase superfamily)